MFTRHQLSKFTWPATFIIGLGLAVAAWYTFVPGRDLGQDPRQALAKASGSERPAVAVIADYVKAAPIARVYEGVGSAQAWESIEVTAKETGVIETIHFAQGQKVKAKQLLLSLDTTELRAEVAVAQAQHDQAMLEAKRAKRLIKTKSISFEEHDRLLAELRAAQARLQAAQARLQDAIIRAPFAGVVGLRETSPGALIEPGMLITTLDDISKIKVLFSVPEVYLAKLKVGLPLTATTAAYAGSTFSGSITAIDSRLDAQTRSIRVIAELPNTTGQLKPGLFMTLKLPLDEKQNAVLVPEEALFSQGRKQFVYKLDNNTAVLQEVNIGQRLVGKVEILSGLNLGEQVAIEGVQKLSDGASVNIIGTAATAAIP